ncbi:MAG TPA: glycosyltransferase [Verrucomicrobiae bacterium]|jgi:glycosyltransferase involved in cell wall biosynthesis
MADFPKLLVATEFPPNMPGGGGAIVRQMLQGWPVEKLFWWSCRPDNGRHFGQKTAGHAVALIPTKFYPHRRVRRQKCWLLENFWGPWAARHFQKTLAAFRPDVVWVISHCWSIPPLARVLPGAGIPFHVSIHDYADVQRVIDGFGEPRSRRFSALGDQLYARASTRDGITRQMTDDLAARTGAAGIVIRAGLEPADFRHLDAVVPPADNGWIRIAYAGTIIVEPEFALFVTALGKIRHQLPKPLSLEFFGDHSYRSHPWFDASWMTEHGNLPQPQLSEALKQCTWGFSPMALADDDPRYNRFSIPAKFTSYLAAGLPVITLGHPECTVVKTATVYDVGHSSTTTSINALAEQLLVALTEPDPRRKYRENLRRCAREEFDASRMRRALHTCFGKQPEP